MNNLIKVLQIFAKYGDKPNPFRFDYDEMRVHGYNPTYMSDEDIASLEDLGCTWCSGNSPYSSGYFLI